MKAFMDWFQDWLSHQGKHIIFAAGTFMFAANAVYPFVDPAKLAAILAGLAALGLYSRGSPSPPAEGQ